MNNIRYISRGVFLILLFCCMGSCKKAPVNRSLEGYWQLVNAEIFEEDKIVSDSLYMSLQLNVVQLRKASPLNNDVLAELGYYQFTGDSLYIRMKTTLEFMELWGFDALNQDFAISEFNAHHLTLYNKRGCWMFRKF